MDSGSKRWNQIHERDYRLPAISQTDIQRSLNLHCALYNLHFKSDVLYAFPAALFVTIHPLPLKNRESPQLPASYIPIANYTSFGSVAGGG